jgi:hypothetical protein
VSNTFTVQKAACSKYARCPVFSLYLSHIKSTACSQSAVSLLDNLLSLDTRTHSLTHSLTDYHAHHYHLSLSLTLYRYGLLDSHGHWTPEQLVGNFSDQSIRPLRPNFSPLVWFYNWSQLITDHIALLPHKPDYFVFNAGIWTNDWLDPVVRRAIVEALNKTGIVGIFKTTTTPDNNESHLLNEDGASDELMCETMEGRCLNLSWTESLSGPDYYWDGVHFQPVVYQQINEQMLDYIEKLDTERKSKAAVVS